ncbi:MAG TPA: histidine kinase [Streptosporangiaceae bacterium]|nr:histidine kinase [Streptosporangiaceae bacterium]
MSAFYAWLSRHPRLVDGLLALVLALLGLASLTRGGSALAVTLPSSAAMIIAVVFRRRNPVTAFTVAAVAGAYQVVLARQPNGTDLAIAVLLYTLAAYRPRRVSLVGLAICLAGAIAGTFAWTGGQDLLRKILVALVVFSATALVAWVLGDSMRYRRAYYASLEDRATRLEQERDAQAKIAAAAERARIARELHDVIAHHVSVMVVQADGAGYALHSDAERAGRALEAIAGTGRQALTEMRRLLGLLRSGDSRAELAPQPGLGELSELVDQARAAGMSVTLTLEGAPRPLPEGAELAAYRVVQESLTNTRKHGGLAAAAAVTLRFDSDGLVVQVTDNGRGDVPPGGIGHGLAGMRERVELYGGSVEAGPLPQGGYRVSARIPAAPALARRPAGGLA